MFFFNFIFKKMKKCITLLGVITKLVSSEEISCEIVKDTYQERGCCKDPEKSFGTCETPSFSDVTLNNGTSVLDMLKHLRSENYLQSIPHRPLDITALTTQFQQLLMMHHMRYHGEVTVPDIDGVSGPSLSAFYGQSKIVNPSTLTENDLAKHWLGIAEMMFMAISAKNGGQFLRLMSPMNTKTDTDFSVFKSKLNSIEGFINHGTKYATNSKVSEMVQIGIGTVLIRMRGMLALYKESFTAAHATTNRMLGGVTTEKHILDPVGASGYMVNWYDSAIYQTPMYSPWYLSRLPITATSLRDAFVFGVEQRAYSIKNLVDMYERAKANGKHFIAHAYPMGNFEEGLTYFGKSVDSSGKPLLDDDGHQKYTVTGGLTPSLFKPGFEVKFGRGGSNLGDVHHLGPAHHSRYFEGKSFNEFLSGNAYAARFFFNPYSMYYLRNSLSKQEYDKTVEVLENIYDTVFTPENDKLSSLKKKAYEDLVHDDYPGLWRLGLSKPIKNVDRSSGDVHYFDGTIDSAAQVAERMKDSTEVFRAQMCTTHYVDPIKGEYFKLVKTGDTSSAQTVRDIVSAYSAQSFPADITNVDDAIYKGGLSLVSFFNDIRLLLVNQALKDPKFGPEGVTKVGPEFSITDSYAALKEYYKEPVDIDVIGYHYGNDQATYFNPNNSAGNKVKPSAEWIRENEQNADGSPKFKYSLPFGNLFRDIYEFDETGAPVLDEKGERIYSIPNFQKVAVQNFKDWVLNKRGTLSLYKLNLITENTRKYIWSDRMKKWSYVEKNDDAFVDVLKRTSVFLQDTLGSSFSVNPRPRSVKDSIDEGIKNGDFTEEQAAAFMTRLGFTENSLMVSANPGTQQSGSNANAMQGILVHEFWVGHAFDFAYEIAHPDVTADKPFGARPAGTGMHKLNEQGYGPSADDFSSAANVEAYATYGEVLAFDHSLHMKIDENGEVLLDQNGDHIPDPIAALAGLNDLSRVGARMVVDVAMHSHKYKWSLSEVIRFFYENTGIGGSSLASFMSRFVFNPVQQQAYGGGLIVNVGVQSFLQNTLGSNFDVAKYITRRIGPDDEIALGVLVPWYKANTQMFTKD